MRFSIRAALLGAGLVLGCAGPGRASVTYDFRAAYDPSLGVPDARVTYVSADYITTPRTVGRPALAACNLFGNGPEHCAQVDFFVFPAFDAVVFGGHVPPPGPILPYFFAAGAFAHAGTYDAIPGWSPTAARLTVTDSGVPEPAGWALMALGFGAAGWAVRRRAARAAA